MIKRDIIKILKKAQSRGVGFYFAGDKIGGMYDIDVENIAYLILGIDHDSVQASIIGVRADELTKWYNANKDMQCTGINKDGKRCNNTAYHYSNHPEDFKYGDDDRCYLHKVNQ